jgi:hypothetical protein
MTNRFACGLVATLAAAGCSAGSSDRADAIEGGATSAEGGATLDAGTSNSPTIPAAAGNDAAQSGDVLASSSEASTSTPGDGGVPGDAALLGDGGGSRSFIVDNRCTQTIWAAALPATTFPGGSVEMAPGYSFQVRVDNGWSGRIWGKVQCAIKSGKLACASDPFPASLAEFTLTKTPATGLDFYDVSLVDGFNVPIQILAVGHTPDAAHPYNCGDPSCAQNLNLTCPQPLQDQVGTQTMACANDECKVLGSNNQSSPYCKYPNQYTEFFKTACPTAYSYPYDDPTSTFTCKGLNDYAIVFCP